MCVTFRKHLDFQQEIISFLSLLYLVCFSSFLVRNGPMSMESPSCMSDSLLAMAMAAYLQHEDRRMSQPLHIQNSSSWIQKPFNWPLVWSGRLCADHRFLSSPTITLYSHLWKIWRIRLHNYCEKYEGLDFSLARKVFVSRQKCCFFFWKFDAAHVRNSCSCERFHCSVSYWVWRAATEMFLFHLS